MVSVCLSLHALTAANQLLLLRAGVQEILIVAWPALSSSSSM